MAKVPALKPKEALVGALVLAMGANNLGALYWGNPFIACLAKPLAIQLYLVFGQLAMIALMAAIAFQLLRKNVMGLIGGGLAMALVIETPRFASYLFLMGASCG